MKLLSLLLLFSAVNVSTGDVVQWMKEVSITNDLINEASKINGCVVKGKRIANGLEHLIKIVISIDQYHIGSIIEHMFVIPDILYLDDVSESIKLQRTLKEIIKDELNIAAPRDFVPIRGITNVTWELLGNARRRLTRKALKNIITKEINGEREVQNVDESGLSGLFKTIVQMIVPSTKSADEPGVSNPVKKRKILATPSLNDDLSTSSTNDTTGLNSLDLSVDSAKGESQLNEEGQDDVFDRPYDDTHDVPIKMMCKCIALLINTFYKTLFIFAYSNDNDNTKCTIEKRMVRDSRPEMISFTKINGVWSQELNTLLERK